MPQLFVSDIEKSCDFYVQKLGFEVGFTYGEPPFYGQVRRDGALLNLRHVDRPVFNAELRAREDLVAATGIVEAVKSLLLEYQEHGVAFHQALRTEPWGARTFIVADPGGNLICLAAENA